MNYEISTFILPNRSLACLDHFTGAGKMVFRNDSRLST